ncbi:MAG: hypothetical protein QW607_11715 [Desulfurococcaceae archaeon]
MIKIRKLFEKKKERKQLPEERENFIKVYKMFLENLVSIFYPIKLEWYEMITMIILGVLFGLGIGWLIKHLLFR